MSKNVLTTSNGNPVENNQTSQTAGAWGPVKYVMNKNKWDFIVENSLIQDFHLIDKLEWNTLVWNHCSLPNFAMKNRRSPRYWTCFWRVDPINGKSYRNFSSAHRISPSLGRSSGRNSRKFKNYGTNQNFTVNCINLNGTSSCSKFHTLLIGKFTAIGSPHGANLFSYLWTTYLSPWFLSFRVFRSPSGVNQTPKEKTHTYFSPLNLPSAYFFCPHNNGWYRVNGRSHILNCRFGAPSARHSRDGKSGGCHLFASFCPQKNGCTEFLNRNHSTHYSNHWRYLFLTHFIFILQNISTNKWFLWYSWSWEPHLLCKSLCERQFHSIT
ncbi:hypothetical protein K501DRAFT_276935 [Backusella circina FSU 941]|nr:hypothetical protein K501DRAFT_276935 [Backusella circina FSU 941]